MSVLASGAMTRSISWADRFAIGLSISCLAHCLVLPVLLVILPSISSSLIAGENVHVWLIYIVIASSLFALGMGCKQHRRRSFLAIGLCGLGFLILGACVDLIELKQVWEQVFTTLGALFIAFAHGRNFQTCHKSRDCSCH
jgi:hypothetical protein